MQNCCRKKLLACHVWNSMGAVRWISGKYFKFQVYRKKNQTSEVLALNPLDLNANYESRFDFDPESFIECTPGGTPQVIYSNSACVILPDGTMHWQRPATLEWPSINERAEILHLQKSLTPTTPDELPDRIITVQRVAGCVNVGRNGFLPKCKM